MTMTMKIMTEHVLIQNVHLYNYSLPFAKPFFVKGERLEHREGVIVHVISDRGDMGFGEASPLPGMSVEPLKRVLHQLSHLKEDMKGVSMPLEKNALLDWLSRRMDRTVFCPSVCFALESALVSLAANAEKKPVCEYLFARRPEAVLTVGLLQGALPEVLAQAAELKAKGYVRFKLKVGNRNIPLDVRKVEELKEFLRPEARIRLDANAQWTFDEALMFARGIGKNQIEFLEDPFPDVNRWEDFYRKTDIPLAADEILKEHALERLADIQGLCAFVVKPMLWGGVTGFIRLLEQTHSTGQKVIVSSAFESGVGITLLANLALATGEPAGLGPASWFAEDILQEPVVDDCGLVDPSRFRLQSTMFHDEFHDRLQAV